MSENNVPSPNPLVIFMPSGRRAHIAPGTSVLDAARQMGVAIESICGGRLTCSKCRIRIEEGDFAKHGIRSSPNHVSAPTADELAHLEKIDSVDYRLSCHTLVHDDVLVYVPEESRGQKQVIRKTAVERAIKIDPAVRQVYVVIDEAQLGDHRGDWGRLQEALAAQWQFDELVVDLHVLRRLQAAIRQGKWRVTVTIWQERRVIDVQPGYVEGIYGLAVDIGSTTIAGHLCDLRTGAILATESMMNPQVSYGEDLMSRISYATMHKDGLEKLHTAVIQSLNKLAAQVTRQAGMRRRDIHEAVFVGNTTMVHILLGINPVELGGAPFALANRDAMDFPAAELGLRLHPGANVHVLPAEAGHVGADNVGVLLAEEPHHQDEMVLLVDVGTNAEIVLGNRDGLYSASSPTGPAFEGAQIAFGMRAAPGAIERVRIDPVTKQARFRVIGEAKWSNEWRTGEPIEAQPALLAAGICGSGIIEAVAEMFLAGILLADGRFNPALADHECIQWHGRRGAYILATGNQTTTGEPIMVTQDDVRNIQLAKAALYAGAKLLMDRAGVTAVDRVVLAGAFGSFIDPQHAMVLGLIPDCALDKVTAVGNAAGDGARIALLNRHKRAEAQLVARNVQYVETAVDPHFQEAFVEAIHFPHANDSFPHLAGILPPVRPDDVPNRARQRRHVRTQNTKQD